MKVVIVGGGVIGCSTAYFLSLKPSCQVILVEQCIVAAAASGKAGGFLARDWCSEPLAALAERSFDLHAYSQLQNNPFQISLTQCYSVVSWLTSTATRGTTVA